MIETYVEAADEARELMELGDFESLRIAVGTAIKLAPGEPERQYWTGVKEALDEGKTAFKTKETAR